MISALLRFHLHVGARLALRVKAPLLAAVVGGMMLLGVDFINSFGALLFGSREGGGPGLIITFACLGVAWIAAPRVCRGLEGWMRHLPVTGLALWTAEAEARRSLAYVPEQPDLTPYATVREILGLVCRLRGEPRQAAEQALALVGLDRLAHRSVRELSMGQRRRALLAAARIGTPGHLLLDEPLEAMDHGAREDILAWIGDRLAAGAALVVVSHDIEPFAPLANRAFTVREGRCLSSGELPGDPGESMGVLERLARGAALTPSPSPIRTPGPPGEGGA